MTPLDIAWLAGLLEGEGHFAASSTKRGHSTQHRIAIRLEMTDEDVVNRAADLAQVGNVYTYQRIGYKRSYYWQVQAKNDVVMLLRLLHPHMGKRRQQQIEACLTLVNRSL